ncbi:MAG: glycosyltransferase [Bacteroidetes bacterium]|nr:glycosyltransferase [Bacteroidota bacterium]MBU1579275.1 glycosyltransferase [Bacteroidota bacterium]MBU2557643.1 glycosyltransferase [Bacteroidota bacterium]
MEINYLSAGFVLFVVFMVAFVVQLSYYWMVFGRLAFFGSNATKVTAAVNQEAVSVVISARNEYHNLQRFLPLILDQDYPDFEVVVVNDCSDDESAEFLDQLARDHAKLKVVHLRQSLNFFQGKKFPLSMGIKSAKHDLLLLTDADCYPENRQWISQIADSYSPQTEVVLAYGPYERQPGLLNKLIRYDTLHIAIQYMSLAMIGKPYMGVGRNLSYRKSLFLRNKGFTSHYKISSGDDDLFIHQVANKGNTGLLVSDKNRMVSLPKQSFTAWVRQKRRHLTTGIYYAFDIKLLLGMYSLSSFTFYVSFAALFCVSPFVRLQPEPLIYYGGLVLLFILRLVSHWFIFSKAAQKLGERGLIWVYPWADIFFIIFTPLMALSNLLIKKPKWK